MESSIATPSVNKEKINLYPDMFNTIDLWKSCFIMIVETVLFT